MTANARYRTRARKGIFLYASHAAMTRDHERWAVEAIVSQHLETTECSRAATWEDLKTLAALLDEEQAEYALVGGYALAVHGLIRQTEDIDLLVNPAAQSSRRWIAALSRLPDQAVQALAEDPEIFQAGWHAVRINDELSVDIVPSVAGHPWEEMSR